MADNTQASHGETAEHSMTGVATAAATDNLVERTLGTVRRLVRLLEDPQPGLATWHKMIADLIGDLAGLAEQRFNLNDYALVRLTRAGEAAWAEWWKTASVLGATGVPDVARRARTQPDGRVEFQIHELMLVFGQMMWIGSTLQPFEASEVEFRKAQV